MGTVSNSTTCARLSRRDVLKAGLAAGVTLSAWPLYHPLTLWGQRRSRPGAAASCACVGMTRCTSTHQTTNFKTHTTLSFVYSRLVRHKVGQRFSQAPLWLSPTWPNTGDPRRHHLCLPPAPGGEMAQQTARQRP